MDNLLEVIRERLALAELEVKRSFKASMNSYGSGYDRGFADALREIENIILELQQEADKPG